MISIYISAASNNSALLTIFWLLIERAYFRNMYFYFIFPDVRYFWEFQNILIRFTLFSLLFFSYAIVVSFVFFFKNFGTSWLSQSWYCRIFMYYDKHSSRIKHFVWNSFISIFSYFFININGSLNRVTCYWYRKKIRHIF